MVSGIPFANDLVQVRPDNSKDLHFSSLVLAMTRLNKSGRFSDVRLHCDDGTTLTTSRQLLSTVSPFFNNLFRRGCDCFEFATPPTIDILLPGSWIFFKSIDLNTTTEG